MEPISNYAARLNEVYATGSKPKENLDIIIKYLRKSRHSGLSEKTQSNNYQVLTFFSKWCSIPLQELTEDSILDYLDYLEDYTYLRAGRAHKYSKATIASNKVLLRQFLNSIGKEEIGQLLKEKGSRKREPKDRRDLLTHAEIELLIDAAQLPRDKAIIAVLYESGCRKGEILSSRIRDIEFNDNGCKLTFPQGKTGKRTVQLVYAASYVRAWIEVHPVRNNSEAKLFVSMYSRHEGLSEQGLYYQIQKIAVRAGITKRVNPHSFRHARASDLAEHLTEQQLKAYMGWTQGSSMAQIYVHDPDTDNAILRMNGIEIRESKDEGLKVIRCPRCKELQDVKAQFCSKCSMVLDPELAAKAEAEKDEMKNQLESLKRQFEEMNKTYAEMFEDIEPDPVTDTALRAKGKHRLVLLPEGED